MRIITRSFLCNGSYANGYHTVALKQIELHNALIQPRQLAKGGSGLRFPGQHQIVVELVEPRQAGVEVGLPEVVHHPGIDGITIGNRLAHQADRMGLHLAHGHQGRILAHQQKRLILPRKDKTVLHRVEIHAGARQLIHPGAHDRTGLVQPQLPPDKGKRQVGQGRGRKYCADAVM